MSIGELMRAARIEAGVSQKEMSRRIGRPVNTISLYENGHLNASELTRRNWAIALGKPFDHFLDLPESTMGQRFRKARIREGINVIQFSKVAGLQPTTVYSWENAEFIPIRHVLSIYRLLPNGMRGEYGLHWFLGVEE